MRAGAEGDEPLQRRRPGAQRRGAEHETPLEFGLGVTQQRHHEPCPAAEAAEDRSLAHTGAFGQLVHGEAVRAALLDQLPGRTQQQFPVPGGIAAFLAGTRGSGADWDEAHKKHSRPGNINRTAVRLVSVKAFNASTPSRPADPSAGLTQGVQHVQEHRTRPGRQPPRRFHQPQACRGHPAERSGGSRGRHPREPGQPPLLQRGHRRRGPGPRSRRSPPRRSQ